MRDSLALDQARLRCCELRTNLINNSDQVPAKSGRVGCIRLSEFVEQRYLPFVKTYKKSWRCDKSMLDCHLLPAFGSLPLNQITPQLVMEMHARSRASGLAVATANRLVISLRFMFNLALRWQIKGVQVNPATHLPLPFVDNQRQVFLDPPEIFRLFSALSESGNSLLQPVVSMLLLTGARKREVLDSRWETIDLEHGNWTIMHTKTNRSRTIPIGPDLIELLRSRLKDANGSPWVFANPETGKPFVSIFYAWDAARQRASLPELRMHDLRHSFASFLINSGHSLYEVQKLLGHRTPSMTQRYAHLSDSSLRSAMSSAAKIVQASSAGYAEAAS
jgi:integrase